MIDNIMCVWCVCVWVFVCAYVHPCDIYLCILCIYACRTRIGNIGERIVFRTRGMYMKFHVYLLIRDLNRSLGIKHVEIQGQIYIC